MLYVVATPIGNLSDITFRAVEVLKSVAVIACEDTRHSRKLLDHIGSSAELISFHAHSDSGKVDLLIDRLKNGKDVALISDAGTPGISDPGGVLVEAAHKNNISVAVIPGPSAVTAALSVSGFPSDRFKFIGFLPKKKGRQTTLKQLAGEEETIIFFESPERINKTLKDLDEYLNDDREFCICREITKQFEEIKVDTISNWVKTPVREQGEFVVVIRGNK